MVQTIGYILYGLVLRTLASKTVRPATCASELRMYVYNSPSGGYHEPKNDLSCTCYPGIG